jgi:hypothetical protein
LGLNTIDLIVSNVLLTGGGLCCAFKYGNKMTLITKQGAAEMDVAR